MRRWSVTAFLVILLQGAMAFSVHAQGAPGGKEENGLAGLKRSADAFKEAYNRDDVAALAAMYADDAYYVSPHVPDLVIRGKEKIRENWKRGISGGGHIDTVEVLSGDLSCDLAYLVTRYQATNSGVTVNGRNVLIMKRIGGKWLITAHASVVRD